MDIAVDPGVKEVPWQQLVLSHRTLFPHYCHVFLSLDWHIFHSFCGNQKNSKLRSLQKKIWWSNTISINFASCTNKTQGRVWSFPAALKAFGPLLLTFEAWEENTNRNNHGCDSWNLFTSGKKGRTTKPLTWRRLQAQSLKGLGYLSCLVLSFVLVMYCFKGTKITALVSEIFSLVLPLGHKK